MSQNQNENMAGSDPTQNPATSGDQRNFDPSQATGSPVENMTGQSGQGTSTPSEDSDASEAADMAAARSLAGLDSDQQGQPDRAQPQYGDQSQDQSSGGYGDQSQDQSRNG